MLRTRQAIHSVCFCLCADPTTARREGDSHDHRDAAARCPPRKSSTRRRPLPPSPTRRHSGTGQGGWTFWREGNSSGRVRRRVNRGSRLAVSKLDKDPVMLTPLVHTLPVSNAPFDDQTTVSPLSPPFPFPLVKNGWSRSWWLCRQQVPYDSGPPGRRRHELR